MAEVAIISAVISLAAAIHSGRQNVKSLEKSDKSLDQGGKAAEETQIIKQREEFTKEISGKFQRISMQKNIIIQTDINLTKLEQRITTILSDYTSLLNQVSIVSTLMLGSATATYGSLLGNTEDQPKWKVNLYVGSCVFTICLSVFSVIESFFLSIHIYAEESKFVAGLYPHKNTGTRSFNLDTLKGLSSSYSSVIISFFLSFLSFSFTILSMTYIGLGLSISIVEADKTFVKKKSEKFIIQNIMQLYQTEPEYQGVALFMTIVISLTYFTIIYFFITKYSKYILWPRTCRKGCGKFWVIPEESLKEPMRRTSEDFESFQQTLNVQYIEWKRLCTKFISYYDKCLINESCEEWKYWDIAYEKYLYVSFKKQLEIQEQNINQIRLLQIADKTKRKGLLPRKKSLKFNSDESASKKEEEFEDGSLHKKSNIKF